MSTKGKTKGPAKPVIVIEVGNDWLKLIQAEHAGGGIAISKMYLEKFEFVSMSLSSSLASAAKRLKIQKASVIGCLPRQLVNVRMLELPSVDPEEIADMLELQIGKQTPYSKDEIVSGYRVFNSDREGYSKLMLVIVQRNVLKERYDIIESAGFEVERMSVSSEGMLNWGRYVVSGAGTDGEVGLLDIDSFYSDFTVIVNGVTAFTRSIMIGANQLLTEYEKWKEKFALEVKQSLESCSGESGLEIGKLIVAGAGPNIEGLSNYLNSQLKIPIEARDCLKDVKKLPQDPPVHDRQYQAISLTSLVGMAMAPESLQFNLIPETIKLKRELTSKTKSVTAFTVLLMMFLVSISMYGMLKLYFRKHLVSVLSSEITRVAPEVQSVERMREIVGILSQRRDVRLSAINILSEIYDSAPDDMYFDKINIDIVQNSVLIEGTCASVPDIRSIVGRLEQSTLFGDAQQMGTAVLDQKTRRSKFSVSCSMEKKR